VKNVIKNIIMYISSKIKKLISLSGNLLGIYKLDDGTLDLTQIMSAGWIFMLGMPVGVVFLGPLFSVKIWLCSVFAALTAINLDKAVLQTVKEK